MPRSPSKRRFKGRKLPDNTTLGAFDLNSIRNLNKTQADPNESFMNLLASRVMGLDEKQKSSYHSFIESGGNSALRADEYAFVKRKMHSYWFSAFFFAFAAAAVLTPFVIFVGLFMLPVALLLVILIVIGINNGAKAARKLCGFLKEGRYNTFRLEVTEKVWGAQYSEASAHPDSYSRWYYSFYIVCKGLTFEVTKRQYKATEKEFVFIIFDTEDILYAVILNGLKSCPVDTGHVGTIGRR